MMPKSKIAIIAMLFALAIVTVENACTKEIRAGKELDVRKPALDKEGRFWVYKDGKTLKGEKKDDNIKPIPPYGLPFSPYAWMPAESEKMIGEKGLNLEHQQNPYKGKMCISVTVNWKNPYWVGVGFVSGPDKTMKGGPWWAKTQDGWYYALSGLKKKKFVFHLRGENGGERLQWKVGFLCREKYGDSIKPFPVQSKWITLKKEWTRYELDLKKKDLSRICSLCFVLSQSQQTDPGAPVVFYIDEVYFE